MNKFFPKKSSNRRLAVLIGVVVALVFSFTALIIRPRFLSELFEKSIDFQALESTTPAPRAALAEPPALANSLTTENEIPADKLQAALTSLSEPAKTATYRHPKGWFSLDYPDGFRVGRFEEEVGADTVLIQQTENNLGVQIYSTIFDEPGPLTRERILKDVPDIGMQDEKGIIVAGTPAIIFTITDESNQHMREVWLIKGGRLYQIFAPVKASELLEKVLKTWQWQ